MLTVAKLLKSSPKFHRKNSYHLTLCLQCELTFSTNDDMGNAEPVCFGVHALQKCAIDLQMMDSEFYVGECRPVFFDEQPRFGFLAVFAGEGRLHAAG